MFCCIYISINLFCRLSNVRVTVMFACVCNFDRSNYISVIETTLIRRIMKQLVVDMEEI